MAITITRKEEGPDDLRRAARSCGNVAQARRLLAIALVLEGHWRADGATAAGMDRQSLRDWAEPAKAHAMRSIVGWQAEGHWFNAACPSGLVDKPRSGRPARLTAEQLRERDAIVETGPDVERDGAVRTRRSSLRTSTASLFASAPSRPRFPSRVGAPATSRKRSPSAGLFQRSFEDAVNVLLPTAANGKPIEIWFQDEARVGRKGTLADIWAKVARG